MTTKPSIGSDAGPCTGRCLCGAVRYSCGPLLCEPTFCHCESCRRASGAHVVAWITVPAASLKFTEGKPKERVSSPGVLRSFCADCGTQLTYSHASRAGTIDVTAATLDAPNRIRPADHIWMEDAVEWDRPGDGLPQFRQIRDG